MILGTNKSIEDRIVEYLGHKNASPKSIWLEINSNTPTSLQAVYKSIRGLFKDGVLVKVGKKLSLSEEWIEKVGKLLASYTPTVELSDGEMVTYRFDGLSELDRHWKHVVKEFIKNTNEPVFHSEPHEMWVHLADRYESQMEYIESFEKQKRYCFLVFGGTTFMDKEYRKKYQNEYLSVDLVDHPSFIKENQYCTIVSDIIITTLLSKEFASKIDELYSGTVSENPEFGKKIQDILDSAGETRIRIERNSVKAKKMRRQLSKNFLIPQELIKQYNLF